MIETTLWKHLKPELARYGKFQKISDRFTSGIPDVLGAAHSRPFAFELKQLKGSELWSVRFRPGQRDWLFDWEEGGGVGRILATRGSTVYVFPQHWSEELENGTTREKAYHMALLVFTKNARSHWHDFVDELLRPSED